MKNNPNEGLELKKTAYSMPTLNLIIILASIYIIEILLMFLLSFSSFSPFTKLLIDATLLIAFALPVLFFFLYRPLTKHISQSDQAKEALIKSEERYKLAEKAGKIGSWDWNILTGELHCSKTSGPMFGFDPGKFEITYEAFLESVHPEDRKFVIDSVNAAVEEDRDYKIEHRIVWPDKNVRWLSETGSVIRDDGGQAVRMLGIVQDITERKQSEDKLLKSEERFRNLVETTSDWVWEVDENAVYTYVSPQIQRILGYRSEEIVGKTPFELMPLEEANRVAAAFKSIAASQKPFNCLENINLHKDGTPVVLETSGIPFFDADGKFCGYRGVDRDITRRKQAEEDLRRSRLYFQNMDRISRAISRASDVDSMIGEAVKEILEIFEVDRAWLVYPCDPEAPSWRVPVEATVPEYPGAFAEQADVPMDDLTRLVLRKALATGDPVTFDFSESDGENETSKRFNIQTQLVIALQPKRGDAWLLGMHQCSYKRLWDDDDKRLFKNIAERISDSLINLVLLKQLEEDITERKRAEDSLRLLEKALETTNMGVTIAGTDGRIIYTNPADADMHGHLAEELIGQDVGIFAPKKFRMVLTPKQIETAKTKRRESVNIRKDGSTFPVYLTSDIVKNISGNPIGFVTTCEDITERKQTVEALRISEERYTLAIEGSNDGIWERNLVTGETYFSPRWKETIGYRDSELPNHVDEWKKRVHPDDYDMVIKNVDDYLAGTIDRYTCEYRIRHKDNSWHWMLAKGAKNCDDQGTPTRFAGSHTDITERKKAEEERKSLESQLLQAQKMETIGTLAGGIAHDFNNILSPILICAEVALEDTPKDSETHETIETILKAANRAKDLVKRILLFSRSGEQNRETVKIKEAVNDALKLARSSIPTTITISKKIKLKDETITADSIQIHQLIMNLCTNAYQAMQKSGGEISIELSVIDIDDSSNKLLRLKKGEYILLSISDTGHGIEESTKQRIFDPFFTTKETGKGTGLGLSVVLGIVMNHDGEITVESEVGKGTTFHVYLPRSVQDAAAMQSDEKADPKGVENVLFIDDESAITFVGKNALEHLGYSVTALNNASEALEMFRTKPEHFNIIISDYTMPNMTGLQLAVKLKKIDRDIPVIIASGYNDTINEENMDRFNIDEYITKPFTGPQLGRVIRKVMAKKEDK